METIGKYHIQKKIASGGMATVYKGIQRSLNRPVAVKVLYKKFSEDSQFVERFKRESTIIARLSHPNIINVIDRGITAQGMPYFVMNFVHGTDAAKIIKEKSFSISQNLDVIIQICKALSYAHKNGIIHRDIKPANVLVDTEGNALVADFGIAQILDQESPGEELTRDNMILGTLAYMSPEQNLDSKHITSASDIYSLGVVMYELFTGQKPLGNFKAPLEINPKLPKPLNKIILNCLEPGPEDRPSAVYIKDRLLELLQGAHIQKEKKAAVDVTKMEDIFSILDIIKESRFGTVYLIRHKVQEKLMVAKRYNIPLGGFKSAKLLTNLKHDNIVNIYGVSGSLEHYIIVMEYLSGGSLADRMIMPYIWQEAVKIIIEICNGLAFAHRNRIIHGNLRPSNILFSETGMVKVADFGLNEHYSEDPDKENWFAAECDSGSVQQDIFAVGVIFYKMITGHLPEISNESFKPHRIFKEMPKDIQILVARMLTPRTKLRFQGMEQILAELAEIKTLGMKNGETSIEKTIAIQKASETAKSKKATTILQTIFLFLLLFAAASTFVLVKSQDKEYLAVIMDFWNRLLAVFR